MTNNTDSFSAAERKVVTYGAVMADLNYIAKTSGDDTAYFDNKLKGLDGKTVCGFVVNGIATKLKLSQLLSKLGFRFTSVHTEPSPNKAELQIHPEYAERARDLFSNWSSWIIIEQRLTGNKELDAKWSQVVAKSR
ncbi:MAG: hypothetical protein E7006_03555 [Alphaproteobacteria bacterium]|nr:hypothetical protein [Alphaproteobacteria bacterium]